VLAWELFFCVFEKKCEKVMVYTCSTVHWSNMVYTLRMQKKMVYTCSTTHWSNMVHTLRNHFFHKMSFSNP
jgi:hypothetical protein